MKRSEILFGVLRVPIDTLAVLAALLVSYRLREAGVDLIPGVQLLEPGNPLPPLSTYASSFVLPALLLFVLLAAFLRLYLLRATMSAWSEAVRVLLAAALWVVAVLAWFFLLRRELFYSRVLLTHSAFFLALLVLFGRAILTLLQRSLLRSGIGQVLVVSIGKEPLARSARETLEQDHRYRYLGHLDDLENFKRLVRRHPPDLALQTDPNPRSDETVRLIDYCRSHHVGYGFLPPVLADVPHLLHVEQLGLLPLVRLQPTPLDGWGRVIKRILDIVASVILLIVLWPVFFVVALAIVIDSGFPISYVSVRIGEQGRKRIGLLKFRTMRHSADAEKELLTALNHRRDGPLFKVKNDPRVTRVGRMLRRWSLDELPQLLNVFLGQLSLVGPRPHLPPEVDRYSLHERRVFAVKPGITGLSQISGRSNLPFAEEVRLDLQYIEEWSILLDLRILLRTLLVILRREGAD